MTLTIYADCCLRCEECGKELWVKIPIDKVSDFWRQTICPECAKKDKEAP